MRYWPPGSDSRGSKRLKTLQSKEKIPGDNLESSVAAAAVAVPTWRCTYITSKRIELESPGWSGFEA